MQLLMDGGGAGEFLGEGDVAHLVGDVGVVAFGGLFCLFVGGGGGEGVLGRGF